MRSSNSFMDRLDTLQPIEDGSLPRHEDGCTSVEDLRMVNEATVLEGGDTKHAGYDDTDHSCSSSWKRTHKDRERHYRTDKTLNGDLPGSDDGIPTKSNSKKCGATETRKKRRFSFWKRNSGALKIKDDGMLLDISENKMRRPKSVSELDTTLKLSLFSRFKKSMRRPRNASPLNAMVVAISLDAMPERGSDDVVKVTEQSPSPTNDGINDSPTKTGNSKDRRLPRTEKPLPKARPRKAQKADPGKANKIKPDKVKTNDVPDTNTNMSELTTDVPRLNNKLAYDKISVRPKRRPARNARGAQQKHTIRVIEAPSPVNGFSEDDSFNENHIEDDSHKKDGHNSPATSGKPALPGFLLPPVQESPPRQDSEEASDPPKRALRKSPIGGVPTGFAPSLHDVQAFRNRSKKSEEPISPAPKEALPAKRPADATESKPAADDKPKKSPKVAKKAQKKSGDSSSSVFSWKHRSKSPTSPRKSKTPDHSKDGDKSKGLFSGLKSKKPDKESKSVSLTSKLFSSGDKKEQSKKKQAEIANSEARAKQKAKDEDKVAEKPVSVPMGMVRVTVDTGDTTDSRNTRVLLESKQTSPTPGKVRLPFPDKPTTPDSGKVSKPFESDSKSPAVGEQQPSPAVLETPTSPPVEYDRLTPSPVPDLLGGSLLDQINFEMSKKREFSSDLPSDSASDEENLPEECVSAIAKADEPKPEPELEIGDRKDDTEKHDITGDENRASPEGQEVSQKIDNDDAVLGKAEEIGAKTDSESRNQRASPKPDLETHSETDAEKELQNLSETHLDAGSDKSSEQAEKTPHLAELSPAEVAADIRNVEAAKASESPDAECQKVSKESDVVIENITNAAVAVATASDMEKDTDRFADVKLTDNAAGLSSDSPSDDSSKEEDSDVKIEVAADDIHEVSSKTPEREQAGVEESPSAITIAGEPKEHSTDSQILMPISKERVKSTRTEVHTPVAEVSKPDTEIPETSHTSVNTQENGKPIVASPVSSTNIKEKAADTTKIEEKTIPQKSQRSPAKAARRVKIPAENKYIPFGDHPAVTPESESQEAKPTSAPDSSSPDATKAIVKPDKSKPQTVDTDANPVAKSRVSSGRDALHEEDNVNRIQDRPKIRDSAPPKADDTPTQDVKSQPECGKRTPSVKASFVASGLDVTTTTTVGKSRGDAGRESAPSFFRTQLKPVSRGSTSGKSKSIRISPGDPAAKPLRPRSWDVKDGAVPLKSTDQPDKKAKPSPSQSSPTTEKPKLAEKPKSPVKSPTKSPGAKPTTHDTQNVSAKLPNESGSFAFPDPKPAARQTRQKKEAPGDGDKPQPDWVKIARRHSRHWEDGSSFKPRSSSTSSPTEASAKDRPAALSASPKRRTLSSSKPDVPSPKSSNASSPLTAPSNRTPPVPAVGTSPSSKISPPANDQPKQAGGKPAWLAIAMQKQKKWGSKEEMV